MSWLRSAVNRAVEVGGSNNLTRTVRNYADSVVSHAGQAVAGGAKLLQDRITTRNLRSFKNAVKGLEEVSVSCRGIERLQLLTGWLVALKEIERSSESSIEINGKSSDQFYISDDSKDSPRKPTVAQYYDPDIGGEPMNFRDVFLHSQALEGMTLSMILEAPTEEEVSLLLDIFGLCLIGGNEDHHATVRSIQDLAEAFSSYGDEVLAKREELLQYAQGAIAGLKVNPETVRIDNEVSNIHQNVDGIRPHKPFSEGGGKLSGVVTVATTLALKEPLAQIQLCSRLESLLLKKKYSNNGDSSDIHDKKVDKLKILSESLTSSASKAEKRISDHRIQKEEALNFRLTRTRDVSQLEKELEDEIVGLEKQRDYLEDELRKVKNSLTSAHGRLHNAREEREQFDEASNEILVHFKTKEDELSKAIASYRAESDTCDAFIKFLETTWTFQSTYLEEKEKKVNDELDIHEEYFVNLAICLLSAYKDELRPSIASFGELVKNLKGLELTAGMDDKDLKVIKPRKKLEEEFLEYETKFISTFSLVDSIKYQFYNQNLEFSRKYDQKVKELCDDIENIKQEFESVERPILEIEAPSWRPEILSPKMWSQKIPPIKLPRIDEIETTETPTRVIIQDELYKSPPVKRDKKMDPEKELSKLRLELESYSRGNSTEEIGDWVFDELEKEVKNGESLSKNKPNTPL